MPSCTLCFHAYVFTPVFASCIFELQVEDVGIKLLNTQSTLEDKKQVVCVAVVSADFSEGETDDNISVEYYFY